MALYLTWLAGHFHSSAGLARSSSALCLVLAEELLADSVVLPGAAQVEMHALICIQSCEGFLMAWLMEQARQTATGACALLL